MPVWISSFPRSGNSFMRLTLRSVYGVDSASSYGGTLDRQLGSLLPAARSEIGHEFCKTHELELARDPSPAIYVIRDGRDAYVSYAHFARESQPDAYAGQDAAEVMSSLVASEQHFGGWSGHVTEWMARDAPTAVVRFEELLTDASAAAARACRSLGIALPEPIGAMPALDDLRSVDSVSFRRGVNGSWRDEMPADVEQRFWDRHGSTMERLGYAR